MKFVLMSLMIAFWSQQSFADVNISTSGTEGLFLCNAGIMHQGGSPLCYNPATGVKCDPQVADPGPCTCTTANGVGDFVSAIIGGGDQHFRTVTAAGSFDYSYLVPVGNEFSSDLSGLEFNLGSEAYGAKYMLHFCYRGPAPNLQRPSGPNSTPIDMTLGIYKMKLSLSSLNKKYNLKLGSTASIGYRCDLRGLGLNGAGRGSNESNPGSVESDSSNGTTIGIGDGVYGSGQEIIFTLNSKDTQVPRFCTFTVLFSEQPGFVRTEQTRADFSGYINVSK